MKIWSGKQVLDKRGRVWEFSGESCTWYSIIRPPPSYSGGMKSRSVPLTEISLGGPGGRVVISQTCSFVVSGTHGCRGLKCKWSTEVFTCGISCLLLWLAPKPSPLVVSGCGISSSVKEDCELEEYRHSVTLFHGNLWNSQCRGWCRCHACCDEGHSLLCYRASEVQSFYFSTHLAF